jgi:aminopeptidase N
MRRYYEAWKFRHPEPNDFIRIMEKTSGLQLRWYYNYWINTTKHIDYGIGKIVEQGDKSVITLKRIGELPMPIEVLITLTDGTQEHYYIPLNETFGSKPKDTAQSERIDLKDWAWVNPYYEMSVSHMKSAISKIEIDPNNQTADIDASNNVLILGR